MSTRASDWEREEREALEGLEDQLDAMRRRHEDDPPLELLRAALGDALPGDLQAAVSEHLAESSWSRALVEGARQVEGVLEPSGEARVLARVKKAAAGERQTNTSRRWFLSAIVGPALAAAVLVGWLAGWLAQRGEGPASPRPATPDATVAVASPPPRADFQLPLDKPDVRLTMAALTWRGSSAENQLLADLKPALDAYREGDYQTAEREFASLSGRYPGTIEVLFYQGVARLWLDDPQGAIAALTAAESAPDDTFAADVAWYRAVAEERAGNRANARARLASLCRADGGRGNGERNPRACEALARLDAARPPTPSK